MIYEDKKIKVPRFKEENGFYTTKTRSKQMSKIRSKDTKPEIKFRKARWHLGYRYRKNDKKLIGKPDIVLNKYKTVILLTVSFGTVIIGKKKKKKAIQFSAFGNKKSKNNSTTVLLKL